MKFQITAGKKKGFGFDVLDCEVKIGRKSDNYIILDDESVSSHHARIFQENGAVCIEDCDSVNGIEVNGKVTKKATLKSGDVISIGETRITALDDEDAELQKWQANQAERAASKTAAIPKGSNPVKTIVAGLLVLCVIAAGGFVFLKQKGFKGLAAPSPADSPTPIANSIFKLYFEKVHVAADNIFRYEMKIENGVVFVSVDDLKNKRHIHRDSPIDSKQITSIQNRIEEQQIFSLPPLTSGDSKDVWEGWTLNLINKGESHKIQIINRIPPANFTKVCSVLYDFAEIQLNIASTSMSGEELLKRAEDAFRVGKKLYEERSINTKNLYTSIKSYNESIAYLESIEPKPKFFAEAIAGLQISKDTLDDEIKNHQFAVQQAVAVKNWAKAREELVSIIEKMPDTNDERYLKAKNKLLEVEQRMPRK